MACQRRPHLHNRLPLGWKEGRRASKYNKGAGWDGVGGYGQRIVVVSSGLRVAVTACSNSSYTQSTRPANRARLTRPPARSGATMKVNLSPLPSLPPDL